MTLRIFLTIILLPAALLTASPLHAATPADTKAGEPLTLLRSTALPEITGDFDHFAVDLKRNHLFVSAEVHHSIEIFDLQTGAHLQSLGGFKTPHSVAFSPEKDELLVADGGDSALILVNGGDLQHTARIALIDGSATGHGDSPDAAFYDAANRLYYIGNGGASANLPNSTISIFSVDQGKLIGGIDIPGNNVESMGIDSVHHRLYVNIRDKQQIGVIDLATGKMFTTWSAPGMKGNTALAVDSAHGRIFVAGRKPGIFYVFDTEGKVISQQKCVDINDDMTYDAESQRVYISGTQGLSVFHQDTQDTYSEIANIPTNGAKTSTYVPSVHQFYAIHPKTTVDEAGLLVFRVNP